MTSVGAEGRRLLPVVLVAILVGAVGYAVRLSVLLSTGGILGSSAYDDGVYYAASAALVHGRWPYADFLFLQPPAILLAGAPFAGLGAVAGDQVGVVVARLAWIGMGAVSCALVAVLASRRSWQAGLVAGGFAACFFPLAYGERSTLLEPLATLLLLLALLVEGRGSGRAAVVAGVLAGITVDVKIWYVVPVLVLVAFARLRLRYLLGVVAGAAVVALPFLLRAPEAMVRQVLLDQLGRPRLPEDTTVGRLVLLTGARWTGLGELSDHDQRVVAVVVIAVVVLAAVAALRVPLGRRAVALLAATSAVLLLSPSFFAHYIAYSGPWMALVLGVGAGALLRRLRGGVLRAGGAVVLTAIVVAPTLAADLQPPAAAPSLAPIARASARVDGCVRSDDPGLLAAIGALSRDLDRGCALWPDVTGWTFEIEGFPVVTDDRPSSPAWQRFVTRYLLGGEAVVGAREGTGLSPASLRRVAALPELARSGRLVLRDVPR